MAETFRIGMQVQGSDGQAGTVEDVLYDKDGAARYLVVRDQGVFAGSAVLPAGDAQADGNDVRYGLTRDQIHSADRYDPARHGASAGLTSAAASHYDAQDQDDK